MSTAMMDREVYRYEDKDDVRDVLERNELELDDHTWISALDINPQVYEIQGRAQVMNLPTKSLRVYWIEYGPTGFFQPKGGERLLFINEDDDIPTYEMFSGLHTVPDADVYLELEFPYEDAENELSCYNGWYRDETYPDHFKEAA